MDNDAKHDQGELFGLFQLLILLTISSQHRSAAGVVQLLGKMYALGGHNGLSIFDSVELLDTVTGVWAETVPMLSKRCRLGVATLHGGLTLSICHAHLLLGYCAGKIYACGGYDGSSSLKDILQYNTASNTWKEVGQMKEARYLHAVGVLDDVSKLCT